MLKEEEKGYLCIGDVPRDQMGFHGRLPSPCNGMDKMSRDGRGDIYYPGDR
jgi:hypothetical protein